MLRIEELSAWYGEAQVLRGVSLEIAAGEVVTLCGRNGAGKTTLLRCVMGLHQGQRGTVELDGRSLTGQPAHRRARAGLGWVPDDRGCYATLTVAETLSLPPVVGPAPWSPAQVYDAFPHLHARRNAPSTTLSGGEQQMLALARVLRMGARLLLCDEPTEGLSPLLVAQVGDILRQAKQHGVAVLLVEQNLHFATTVADRHHLLAEGRVVESLENSEVAAREKDLLAYLGI
ncbi:ABC transporter ATP-binding protein [Catellatospora citrea]|uniref:ABC transporter ATP-binding protein n=1 Tax=Catellatospora citrea TaxID=53366 RepID=A0A8J3KAS3_9ACTN|nr:ABC transporter ATP-binding protein [Catellatospora citrea]RKE11736.1 amino acid/amide ABC transporter ATP-binding protein 2 (HAAT family) [Catellatospora citrea]GIF99786.1 ABC transporter ATP-binding protein [Catellatospora citrea]